MTIFKEPTPGASLMIAYQAQKKQVVVLGHSTIAAQRVFSCLEAEANVFLVSPDPERRCEELNYRIQQQQVTLIDIEQLTTLTLDLAFVCESMERLDALILLFRTKRVPVNVTDRGDLSDFFMTSTYRDQSVQIAVSTNGQASKLSSRIRRHVTSHLPPRLGDAVHRVGVLRRKLKSSDPDSSASMRRMKWLAQLCEYWSMDRLAELGEDEMESMLDTYHEDEGYSSIESSVRGTMSLVGSGPGDPDLLTVAALKAIQQADLVLADKIVPAEILALVTCELKIARKFPGHAHEAQQELNRMALRAVLEGKNVVRLKQGDPYLFGRGAEEVLFFRSHKINPYVVPGLSSSVAAPLLAGIPLTHRSIASQFLVTTGTGAQLSATPLPTYHARRTDVFLMAVHRLHDLVADLIATQQYPADVPCAIIERASCKDQRVLWGPLNAIEHVLESAGGSRPPGLLVVGHAVHALQQDNKETGVAEHINGFMPTPPFTNKTNLLPLHDPLSIH